MRRLTHFALVLGLTPQAALASPPLTLQQAIAQALKTHPDAVTAEAQLNEADLNLQDTQAGRFQISTDVSAFDSHDQSNFPGTGSSAGTDQPGFNGTVGLTVPLFTGFQLSHSVASAAHRRDAADADRLATREDLTLAVTQAFWNLRKAELTEGVQRTAVEETERTLNLTKTSFQLGRATASDVDRAEVGALNARGDALQIQGNTQQARVQLAVLLGIPSDELAIDSGAEVMRAEFDAPQPGAINQAIEARPEIRSAEARLAAAQAAYDAAGGARWPQLAWVTTYQYGNNPYNPTLGARGFNFSPAGFLDTRLALSYNLFNGGKTTRAIARAFEDWKMAEASLEKTRRDVRSQIQLALVQLKSAHERLTVANRSASLAEHGIHWVQARYEQGYSGQVEVNDALGSLVTARTQRIQALVDEELARAKLSRALGKL